MAALLALFVGGIMGGGTGFSIYQLLRPSAVRPTPVVNQEPARERPQLPQVERVAPPVRVRRPPVAGAKLEPQPEVIRNRVLQRAYVRFRDIFALGHDEDSTWDDFPAEKALFAELHTMCNNLVNWGILLQNGATEFNEEDEDYIEELIERITTHVRENMLLVIQQYDNTTMEVDFDKVLQEFMKEVNRLRVVLPKLLNVRIQRQYIRV